MSELAKALKNMIKNENPGTDGFSRSSGKKQEFCYAIISW